MIYQKVIGVVHKSQKTLKLSNPDFSASKWQLLTLLATSRWPTRRLSPSPSSGCPATAVVQIANKLTRSGHFLFRLYTNLFIFKLLKAIQFVIFNRFNFEIIIFCFFFQVSRKRLEVSQLDWTACESPERSQNRDPQFDCKHQVRIPSHGNQSIRRRNVQWNHWSLHKR